MHSFSGYLFEGSGRLSLILQDTAVKRERNKKDHKLNLWRFETKGETRATNALVD
jgi:hypothetical protein